MIEAVVSLVISAATLGFSVLVYLNNTGRRTNERLTRIESELTTMVNVPQRLTKVETVADYSHARLNSLEEELKEQIKEIKDLQIEILRNTKV